MSGMNIEIKAPYPDLKKAARLARQMGAQCLGRRLQRDTYFRVRNGRLKLREEGKKKAELILYFRQNTRQPRKSDYQLLPVSDAGAVGRMLSEMIGAGVTVEKARTVYVLEDASRVRVRIHLDRVKGLGNFVEFEAIVKGKRARARAAVEELMRVFGIKREDVIPFSYGDMLRGEEAESGE